MAFFITNIAASYARQSLVNVQQKLNTRSQRLSSGLRINSAKDDPAGLQISTRLSSEIDGLRQAQRNSADGQALALTVEGALEEIQNLLQQMRVLAVQYNSGLNSPEDKAALQAQASELSAAIDKIATSTKFGGKEILNGASARSLYNGAGMLVIHSGAYSSDTVTLDMSVPFTMLGIEMAVLNTVGTTMTGATIDNKGVFHLDSATAIEDADQMLALVTSKRADVGAFQNRLESSLRLQATAVANESDARSRLRDTDFAEETAQLAQQRILEQSSLLMLLHAQNSHSSSLMGLLGTQY